MNHARPDTATTPSLEARLASLTPAQRAALEKLRLRPHAAAHQGVSRRADGIAPELSFGQQRLWFLDRLFPRNAFYNQAAAIRITASIDRIVLQRSINEIVRRHEALRATFTEFDGKPVPSIIPELRLDVPVVDLRSVPAPDRELRVAQVAEEEARTPFDLSLGPLVRARLVRMDEADYTLLVTMHHIICDAGSMEIFSRELTTLYGCFGTGRSSPLKELPIQYSDYAAWQRQNLRGDKLQDELSYWSRKLRNLPSLRLPTDRLRPPVQSFRGGACPLAIDLETTERARELSRAESSTLFMLLLACFAVLLYRYTGQTDIPIGSPVSGRTRTELEDLIGFFVNTLVLRVELSADISFRALLRSVRETALAAYAHQELPFEKLVEHLHPERDLGQNPLFQVTFQLRSTTGAGSRPELSKASLASDRRGASVFDLAVNLVEIREGIGGHIEYSTDLFEAASIDRLAAHFGMLLRSALERPDVAISQLTLLDDAERRQLERFSTSRHTERGAHPVHVLFAARASEHPERIAVSCGNERITYGELDARASMLSSALEDSGIGNGKVVAICLERSIACVVAELATLKAGGAYLPIDPAQPSLRRKYLLGDSCAAALLTSAAWLPEPEEFRAPVFTADGPFGAFERARGFDENTRTPATVSRDAAYMIYTSGSTGDPKGVLVSHSSLSNLVAWHVCKYAITEADQATLISSPSFDASVWETWPYLVSGATLHVADDAIRPSASDLIRWFAAEGITISFLPTQVASAFLEEKAPPGLRLRALLTGGEKLHRGPSASLPYKVFNHYGPTEGTVVSTSIQVDSYDKRMPAIGFPIDNVEAHVVDRNQQRTPIGVPGELYIGGAGVAIGYHNRPALTAEKFAQVGELSAGRLYRTGDIVRFRSDGSLEFVGRLDDQVKLRGHRIEIGEIEATINSHTAVEAAAVMLRGAAEKAYLAAYVVSHADNLDPQAITRWLEERLPRYMVPAAVVFLESLPTTPSGKTDFRALPEPEATIRSTGGAGANPTTDTQNRVAAIWREVLGLPSESRLGINLNFFTDLGGHSLLAVQVISRVRSVFGQEIPLKAFFEGPTIAALSAGLDSRKSNNVATPIARLSRSEHAVTIGADGRLAINDVVRNKWKPSS